MNSIVNHRKHRNQLNTESQQTEVIPGSDTQRVSVVAYTL